MPESEIICLVNNIDDGGFISYACNDYVKEYYTHPFGPLSDLTGKSFMIKACSIRFDFITLSCCLGRDLLPDADRYAMLRRTVTENGGVLWERAE